jgi:hypothetical protein
MAIINEHIARGIGLKDAELTASTPIVIKYKSISPSLPSNRQQTVPTLTARISDPGVSRS